MLNIMKIDDYQAVISYDPEIELFRGEFVGLNGGADFYASTVEELHEEAKKSLNTFLEVCKKQGINPRKTYSGKFNIRIKPEIHAKAVIAAQSQQISLNEWISQTIANATA